jgi:hypothetical protein
VHALEIFFFRLEVSPSEGDSPGEAGRFFGGMSPIPTSSLTLVKVELTELRLFQGDRKITAGRDAQPAGPRKCPGFQGYDPGRQFHLLSVATEWADSDQMSTDWEHDYNTHYNARQNLIYARRPLDTSIRRIVIPRASCLVPLLMP